MNSENNRKVLDNGIVVLTAENPAADIIAARIFLKAGSRYLPAKLAGLTHLLAAVLTKGTEKKSSQEVAEAVESVGARLSADAANDYFLLSLKTVSADFAEILGLAAELLRSPTFPEAEVELERKIAMQAIRSQLEQPFAIAFEQLRDSMYQDHPYAFSTLGTEETISQVSRADIQHFHQTYFRPDNVVITVAGRIGNEEAISLIEEVFGDWEVPTMPLPILNLPAISTKPRLTITPQETQQSVVMLGYLTPAVLHPDYAAMKLLNTYLGNGLSSRLFVELREKRGLAYDVSALYPTRIDSSQFVVYMGTAPENSQIALEGLRSEVERLTQVTLSDEELETSKNKMLGQYALGKQTNSQIAQILGWYEILGLGIEFDEKFQADIAAVTVEEVQLAACRYFIEPYISLVGPGAIVNQLNCSGITQNYP